MDHRSAASQKDVSVQQDYLDLRGRIRLPIILQTEAAECGIACLAMVASSFGHRIDIDTLRRRHPVSLKGMTLRGLIETARHLELACRPLRVELAHLAQLRLPAILHWDMNHFVAGRSPKRYEAIFFRMLLIDAPIRRAS
jgi:ATP-binding cassette, subfamily B, bacterial CvaB/MchF/RaxB